MNSTIEAPASVKFKRQTTRKNLTKRTVESLAVPPEVDGKPQQSWTYDSTTPRLAVCVWSSGARTWYWVGRCNARMIRYKLGGYPEISPENARKLAAKVSNDVAQGIDPRIARNKKRDEGTLAELFDRYIDEHAKVHKRTWQTDRAVFDRYCGSIKSRTLTTIDRPTIAALHRSVGKANGQMAANRLMALLSKVFSFAGTDAGFVGLNPCKGIKKFPEVSRDRFLNADELQRFFKALESETEFFGDFFKLLVFTGARKANVMAMRFDQVDLVERTWRIPLTKIGEPLTVHLVDEAVEILRRRHAASDGNEWVFPGGKKNRTSHLIDPKGAWERVREASGLADVRMHDLRRTLGSWQAATGASLPVIGKSLGHKNQSTTQIYARLNIDPVRASVDKAVAAMLAAGKSTTATESNGGEQ